MSIKHIQHFDAILCSPQGTIDDPGKIKHVRHNGRTMNPPDDFEVDDDAADVTQQSSKPQQQESYPTSGSRLPDAVEDKNEDQAKAEDEDDDMAASWAGQPAIKGSTETMRMALLTFSLIGLQ
jgi:hypothetical protein